MLEIVVLLKLFFIEKLKPIPLKAPIKKLLLLPLFLLSTIVFAQESYISGVLLDENNNPIPNVSITANGKGTVSKDNGSYSLEIPTGQKVEVIFSALGFEDTKATFDVDEPQVINYSINMKVDEITIGTVTVRGNTRKDDGTILTIPLKVITNLPGAQDGITDVLKTLPGTSGNNELSSQYRVRGGNFDENLVYVNDIEVYRPFLIRSGQQEGLNFVNSDLVSNIDFSAGGFQAKYGDKLSSVLDITYKTPTKFGASLNMNLLGGSIAVEGVSKDSTLSGVIGVRYRDNSLFVDARETQTNYDPLFVDVQTYLTKRFSKNFSINFLGNASLNQYNYEPESRQTNFGTLENPLALLVFYQGQERDQYQTLFGALKANYDKVIDSVDQKEINLKFITSTYHTIEEEHFDILAQYRLGEVNTDIGSGSLGDVEFSEGIGSQLNHARNDLDALIFNAEHKGSYTYNKKRNKLDWGIRYTHEDIRDKLVEWEVIDSAGFSIRPPFPEFNNDQPYTPFEGPLEPFQNIRATNFTNIDRISGYAQWSKRDSIQNHKIWYNVGVRAQSWTVSGRNIESNSQMTISPRAQFA
ncbi:MAG: carboxypeptidase-like regulatory domain-containing protein, partial [Flavobacteriaceae bacterium]|nr:carboxypeptidase-like regulatory domain-containing protein [Flavobacteriaceae bacterium]